MKKDTQMPQNCSSVALDEARKFEELALATIRHAGFRITMTRVQVIRALAETHLALSAQDIHSRIKASDGRVDLVSVYRILSLLQDAGLVHFIGIANGYIACQASGAHAEEMQHFVCRQCGCVEEAPIGDAVKTGIRSTALSLTFRSERTHIEVRGVCNHCA